ncbi:hypothetical protein ACLB1R_16500 [Escherichia coli]
MSFIPIFTKGQEGRLFGPLAFTKTYAWRVRRCWTLSDPIRRVTGSVAKFRQKQATCLIAF